MTPQAQLLTGPNALTSARARSLLGWAEVRKPRDANLRDATGKHIRLSNARRCRPLDTWVTRGIVQDVLHRHLRFNGEPITLGASGQVLSGLELAVGFVLACQEWGLSKHWRAYWKREPTLETLLVTGVDESDQTYRTLHRARPLTVSDALYRSEYFAGYGHAERDRCSRVTEAAIAFLWGRCGYDRESFNPHAPLRTVAESLAFLERHPRLLECVRFVHELFRTRRAGERPFTPPGARYLPHGWAAGLLYLMGSSQSVRAKYDRSERSLNWKAWGRACAFWREIADGPFRYVRGANGDYLFAEGEGKPEERLMAIIRTWNGQDTVGGIDLEELETVSEDQNEDTPALPTADELRTRRLELVAKKILALRGQ